MEAFEISLKEQISYFSLCRRRTLQKNFFWYITDVFVFQPKLTEVHTYEVAYTALILMPIGLFNLGFFVSSLWSLVGKKGYGSKSLIIFFLVKIFDEFPTQTKYYFWINWGFTQYFLQPLGEQPQEQGQPRELGLHSGALLGCTSG